MYGEDRVDTRRVGSDEEEADKDGRTSIGSASFAAG